MDDLTKDLLRKWIIAEEAMAHLGDIPDIIKKFRDIGDGWEVDFYLPTHDDNPIIKFYHRDHPDIFVHTYNNDDPFYSPMTLHRTQGLYSNNITGG